jgi:hypothetical protein
VTRLSEFIAENEAVEAQHRAEVRRVLTDAWNERAAWIVARLHDEAEGRPDV